MDDLGHPATVYPVFKSEVVETSDQFKTYSRSWVDVLKKYEDGLEWAAGEGEKFYIERHRARGMLLEYEPARDRLSLVLDEDSPFLELMPFAGYGIDSSTQNASIIVGIGLVEGIPVMINANVPTIAGGAHNQISVKKQLRACEIALENSLPSIYFSQGAGANLLQQFTVFHDGGKLFRDIAVRSEAGAPTCTIVLGSSSAGAAYQPGMSDYSIFVKEQTQVFLGGPPLVKMATGEDSTAEELGGAEMHASVSGVADALANNEIEACRLARSWVRSINRTQQSQRLNHHNAVTVLEPRYPAERLLGIVPTNLRLPLNMSEVVAHIVDDSRFEAFKPHYGSGMLCCWAYIHGILVGIIGNQSPAIFTREAQKAAQFIHINNASDTPIVFLHNVTGFMVGKKVEQEGIIKAGSILIDAVSRSTVSHISIICGSSYGAGNYAMCGRAYGPRFIFSWPNSKCSAMGPEQLSGVMEMVSRQSNQGAARAVAKQQLRTESRLSKRIEEESQAYNTSAWCLDDGIIDPRDTRHVLGMCLEATQTHRIVGNKGFRGVARF